ncbi:hypothetical protein FRC03_000253 [Tulasnella sp. 419]|nr:hypothetical protein FRC03_000253 [Tulasnella sp. 419]
MRFNQTLSTISPLLSIVGLTGTFNFKGTGVWLEGNPSSTSALVPSFEVVLDSHLFTVEESTAVDNVAIFNESVLNGVDHSIVITPVSVARSIGWEIEADADTKVTVDNSVLFSASSNDLSISGVWQSEACIPGVLSSGTCQAATSEWALSYSFIGDAVTLWGALADDQTQYSVSIDNASPVTYKNRANSQTPSVILAQFSNLGSGKHTFTVRSAGTSSRFALDKLDIFTKEASYDKLIAKDSSIPHSTRIGIVVGTILAVVAICVALAIFLIRRQRIRRQQAATALPRTSQDTIGNTVEKQYAESMLSEMSSVQYKPSLFGQPVVSPTPVSLPPLSYRNDEEITTARGRTKMALLTRFGL